MSIFVIASIAFMTRCDFPGSGIGQQLGQHVRHDLPRHSEFVFDPTTLSLGGPRGQLSQ